MLAYAADVIKLLRSKIGRRIGILVFIQIFFLVTSLVVLSYYQSQMTYLGNSINIAGKNRFLSSNLMYNTAEFYLVDSNDISNINSSIKELETNILTLKNGGKISDIELKPLPYQFYNDWHNVYQKWISLKTILSNNILKESQTGSSKVLKVIVTPETSASSSLSSELEINKIMKTIKENGVIPLVNSSNVLVTKLGEYAKDSSENSIFLQRLFAVLNIGVTSAFILYIIRKLLQPIFALTTATVEVKRGNLNVLIKNKVKGDELSFLIDSFNSMITSIKNYIKKQNELQKELEKTNEELKYRDQLKDEFINVAAHELKTPLQPIVGLCELLRDRTTDIVKDEEILDVIIRNSKRLMKLAEDILNVARIESGSFFLKKEKFDISEMIAEIMKDTQQKIVESKKNIKLSFELYNGNNKNNNKIIVEADKNRLIQVISNLLNNAIKFTKEGQITVIVKTKKINNNNNNNGKEFIVSIKDTGTGIDSEILPKLFTK
ncbi:MAG TPA: HAMP domain-containing sensor histidine kinase, partial [Nitrososphaeraceae archaeon]|nr:HAMP domain-containing sensor histidine kinase [Nitrososphaeraceae archaeon]